MYDPQVVQKFPRIREQLPPATRGKKIVELES
jgi:hypothetical protein